MKFPMKFSHEVCKIGLKLNFELDFKKMGRERVKSILVE